MRIGIIGLGRIGSFHARTLQALDAVESLVVYDPVAATSSAVGAEVGADLVDSPAALLSAGVDGVVIAAATTAHPDLIKAAVTAGVPTFCEKPVAADADEAREVRDFVATSDVPVQIGYPRRFDVGFLAVRDAVLSGRLGFVHTVRSTTLDPAPPPAAYIAGSGGIFRDCSVHDFDAVRWATGHEVTRVYAAGSNKGAEFFRDADDVDTAAVVLTMADGTLALISNSRYNARGYDVRLEAHGSTDSIAAGLDDHLPLASAEPGATFPAGPPATFFMDRLADAFRAELSAFTEVVAGSLPSPCTVADATATGLVAEAATLSLHRGEPVDVAELER